MPLWCARTVVVCLSTDYKPEEPIENYKTKGSPRWHFWETQTAASMKHLTDYLIPKPGQEPQYTPEKISVKDVGFSRIGTLDSLFPDLPLSIVQAHSAKLIKPQFGPFVDDTETMKRLAEFNEAPVRVDTSVPHFYG